MSTGSSPPQQPPMMSPDGKWVWNGQQWVPVAVHESVFSAYDQATAAAAADPIPETMVSAPVNPFAAAPPQAAPAVVSPVISPPMSYTSGNATPPWQAPAGGKRSQALYVGAALIAVVLGVVLVIYFGLNELPFLRAATNPDNSNPPPAVTPTPQLATRSQSGIAARYVTSVFTPGVSVVGGPLFQEHEVCDGQLSFACQDALTSTDKAATTSLAMLGPTPPVCIAPYVAKVVADIALIDAAVKAGLKGYTDNNRVELVRALGVFNLGNRPLQADIGAVLRAQTQLCDAQQEGP